MSVTDSGLIRLNYGRQGCFSCSIDAARILVSRSGPEPNTGFRQQLRHALAHPLEFPPMGDAIIPEDRVVLALDRHTPGAAELIAEVWRILEQRGVSPENVLILQPTSLMPAQLSDPRSLLPEDVRGLVQWKVHDATDAAQSAYLATTACGERVYLARELIDADIVLLIGMMAYDPVLGYRGTNTVFYPGLSSKEAFERVHGQGHFELGPGDHRPVRQLVDDVAWLLGTQFSIQVLASAGEGVSHVVAGITDSVFRESKRLLDAQSLILLDRRAEIVVVAVDYDAAGHGWEQIGAALATARNLVSHGGKIVVLSELRADLGEGLDMLSRSESPREAMQPLRTLAPPDLIPATQLAHAVDWADVYLLSKLESDLVEDLFAIPLSSEVEIVRLLAGGETCAFLGSAQQTFGQIASS